MKTKDKEKEISRELDEAKYSEETDSELKTYRITITIPAHDLEIIKEEIQAYGEVLRVETADKLISRYY